MMRSSYSHNKRGMKQQGVGFPVLLLWYVGIPAILVGDQVFGGLYVSFRDIVPFMISISLYVWILGNVMLTVKIPVLQNFISYDKRVQFHILSSFGILIVFLLHALPRVFGGYVIDLLAWSLLVLISLLFLMSWYWISAPIFSFFQKIVARFTKRPLQRNYDRLKLMHGLGFRILTVLAYFHIRRSSIEENGLFLSPYAFTVLFTLALIVICAGYVYRIRRPKGKIQSIARQNGLCVVQVALNRKLRYRAGQFAFISVPQHKGMPEDHPFSFLSSPTPDSNQVSFGIKIEGDFTERFAKLAVGTALRIDGPYGAFYPKKHEKVCLIGTGIGVVPILSILSSHTLDTEKLYALFSVRNISEIPQLPEFQMTARREKTTDETPAFSPGYEETSGNTIGNIMIVETARQLRISADHFLQLPGNITDYVFYLCSSSSVRTAIVSILHSLGVRPANIIYEKFSF